MDEDIGTQPLSLPSPQPVSEETMPMDEVYQETEPDKPVTNKKKRGGAKPQTKAAAEIENAVEPVGKRRRTRSSDVNKKIARAADETTEKEEESHEEVPAAEPTDSVEAMPVDPEPVAPAPMPLGEVVSSSLNEEKNDSDEQVISKESATAQSKVSINILRHSSKDRYVFILSCRQLDNPAAKVSRPAPASRKPAPKINMVRCIYI